MLINCLAINISFQAMNRSAVSHNGDRRRAVEEIDTATAVTFEITKLGGPSCPTPSSTHQTGTSSIQVSAIGT
jgi:hypothetical protein